MNDAMRLVWCDMEMTGLSPETCAILEIAVVITGPDLNPIAEIERIVWQPDEVLARMDPFVRDMHTKNGLLERVRASKHSLQDVEKEVMAVLTQHTRYREGILAGNSIHQDRRFLQAFMPAVVGHLHYRQLDVSSLKVLTQAWYPDSAAFRKPGKDHTALADIRASMEELTHYRRHIFLPPPSLSASDKSAQTK